MNLGYDEANWISCVLMQSKAKGAMDGWLGQGVEMLPMLLDAMQTKCGNMWIGGHDKATR